MSEAIDGRPDWAPIVATVRDLRTGTVTSNQQLAITDRNSTHVRIMLESYGVYVHNEWAIYGAILSQLLSLECLSAAIVQEHFEADGIDAQSSLTRVLLATMWDLIPRDVK